VIIKILTRGKLMRHHPESIRSKALASLKKRDVEIVEECLVQEIKSGLVIESTGEKHTFDILFLATGVKANPVFKSSGLETGPDGGLRVNRFLQHTRHPEIFGGGDCIYFEERPLDKVGVFAVRQNPVLLHNLMAAMEGEELEAFEPGGKYLLIFNLGDDTGILYKWSIQLGGHLAFRIKDIIDRRFMHTFQAFEK
jgi:NADH dehydrogenase FAD-containing subunit